MERHQKRDTLNYEESNRPLIQDDQRDAERFQSQLPLIFARFGTGFHRDFASMTFNHSSGGMCLEAAEPFKPGSAIFIRLVDAPGDQTRPANWTHLRNSTLAEVKWCQEFRDKLGTHYRIGVKYY